MRLQGIEFFYHHHANLSAVPRPYQMFLKTRLRWAQASKYLCKPCEQQNDQQDDGEVLMYKGGLGGPQYKIL